MDGLGVYVFIKTTEFGMAASIALIISSINNKIPDLKVTNRAEYFFSSWCVHHLCLSQD
jgi:hypothetical protein